MIKSLLSSASRRFFGAISRRVSLREYLDQQFRGFNERSVEYAFVFQSIAESCPKTILDVGTGVTALPQLMRTCGPVVTAIDNISDYWSNGMVNRHYHVINDNILNPKLTGKFDLITCISTLEHIEAHNTAVDAMFSLLAPGGRLILSFPYCEGEYVPNVYALQGSIGAHVYPFKTQIYSRQQVDNWVKRNGAYIVHQEYWRFFSGKFWTLGDRIVPPVRVDVDQPHQICCLALERKS
jgi:SAM-dependent methyltransferase